MYTERCERCEALDTPERCVRLRRLGVRQLSITVATTPSVPAPTIAQPHIPMASISGAVTDFIGCAKGSCAGIAQVILTLTHQSIKKAAAIINAQSLVSRAFTQSPPHSIWYIKYIITTNRGEYN